MNDLDTIRALYAPAVAPAPAGRTKGRSRCRRCDGTGRIVFSSAIGVGRCVCPICHGNG